MSWMRWPRFDEIDKLRCKISKLNGLKDKFD